MDLTKECILAFSPLLRGLTFDGEKGNYVVFDDNLNINKNIKALSINTSNINDAQLIDEVSIKITTEFGNYKKNKNLPDMVVINGIGSFYIDKSYDNIIKKISGRSIESEIIELHKNGLNNRNHIVKNKISVVTGGAQGFGEGIVNELASMGSFVFIADMNFQKAGELSESLNHKYNRITSLPVEVNITDENSVENMILEIVKKTGGIDIFISNAGVLKAASVKEMTLDTFSFVTNVNYTGYFLCVKYASKVMALQNKPSGKYYSDIIQINSKSGLEGSKKNAAYAGGKFGGIGLTQSFALELIEDNIKVNSICPGNFFEGPLWSDPENGLFIQYLRTGKVPRAKSIEDVKKFYEEKVPMGRGCGSEDVIKAIYYIIDQKYETGQAIPVTGGQVMLK